MDPTGEFPWGVIGACIVGGAINIGADWLSGRKITIKSGIRSGVLGCASGVAGYGIGKLAGKALPKVAGKIFSKTSLADDVSPKTPVGRTTSPIKVKPGTNASATMGGRQYSGHALDRIQQYGITPS